MNFEQSLEVLNELTKFGINLGLERISSLLGYFDNPQNDLQVIHIGGTNGKGSTAAMLTSILCEAGYKVGTYTSPHLHSYTERIKINNIPIGELEFASLLKEMLPYFDKVIYEVGESPTEFEVITALALLYFKRTKTQIVVLEVGMGGDIDSTNVINNPLVSVITNVSYDHADYLGETLQEIAMKKSGIIKKNRPVVTASEEENVLTIIRNKAHLLDSPLYEVQETFKWDVERDDLKGQLFNLRSVKSRYQELYIPLKGQHQLTNCATAIKVIEVLQESGYDICNENIKLGLKNVLWPGRLETVKNNPLVIIDGAHNPAGMKELASWLSSVRKTPEMRIISIIGMLADKDRCTAVKYLDPLLDEVIITKPPSARAGNWHEVKEYFNAKLKRVHLEEDYKNALKKALDIAKKEDMILITGSLYLIGEIRGLIKGNLKNS